MEYNLIPPCKKLESHINHFWVCTWDAPLEKPNTTYYVVGSSLSEIVFAFNGNEKNSSFLFSAIQGHTHLANQYPVDEFHHLIGVAFYSYAIPNFFNIPATELNEKFMPLNTFLGKEGILLNEKIETASSTKERIDVLSEYFKSLLNQPKMEDLLITKAIKAIKNGNGNLKIEPLAYDFGLSQKQFNRRFKQYSGFNPKTYSRVIRFESVIKQHPTSSSLTEIAHENGYFDQAHFNNEFKLFTGFNPKDFWNLSDDDI
ncbi:helix-turn-helix domain-containing protein [Cellulophaga baltica]|uniref:Transcriptional regulator, AraC family n=1 Tax=Cellulophaga baltica TaxID=76594 RepID=A0A1G7LZG0_9FLAO|nr:helix-turn-helix domain-containing protein [Cellulophaga baltica]SDF54823.1 transcriptional regulator, AraC family [Cellulophaga baltica]